MKNMEIGKGCERCSEYAVKNKVQDTDISETILNNFSSL